MLKNNLVVYNEDNTRKLYDEWYEFPEKLEDLTPFQFVAISSTAESFLISEKEKNQIEKVNTQAKILTLAFVQLFPINIAELGKKIPEINGIDLVYYHRDILTKLLRQQITNKCFLSQRNPITALKDFRFFGDNMSLINYEQFAIMDNLFQLYMHKGEMLYLDQFIAHTIVKNGEEFNGEKADGYLPLAEKLNPTQKKAIVRNYLFLRAYLRKLYPKAFNSNANHTGEHDVVEHTKEDLLQLMDWLNLQLSIAESGIFGTFQEVRKVNINYVLKYLHEQKIKQEELEKTLESKN